LLDAQWDTGGLPDDVERLRRIARASVEEWNVAWPYIEEHFPVDNEKLRRNYQLEMQRGKALQMREARRRGGRATAAKRWGTQA
jgi:uncharacterized protein YdaU (DUF1376 family)